MELGEELGLGIGLELGLGMRIGLGIRLGLGLGLGAILAVLDRPCVVHCCRSHSTWSQFRLRQDRLSTRPCAGFSRT